MNQIAEDKLMSARQYVKSAQFARARFERDGDLEQQEWAEKYLLAARLHVEGVREMGVEVEPELEALLVSSIQPVAVEPEPKRARCPHYRAIREMFAVARELGLDVSDDARDRMRGAIGMLLGRRIESRADLSGAEWAFCTNAMRMNRLFW